MRFPRPVDNRKLDTRQLYYPRPGEKPVSPFYFCTWQRPIGANQSELGVDAVESWSLEKLTPQRRQPQRTRLLYFKLPAGVELLSLNSTFTRVMVDSTRDSNRGAEGLCEPSKCQPQTVDSQNRSIFQPAPFTTRIRPFANILKSHYVTIFIQGIPPTARTFDVAPVSWEHSSNWIIFDASRTRRKAQIISFGKVNK